MPNHKAMRIIAARIRRPDLCPSCHLQYSIKSWHFQPSYCMPSAHSAEDVPQEPPQVPGTPPSRPPQGPDHILRSRIAQGRWRPMGPEARKNQNKTLIAVAPFKNSIGGLVVWGFDQVCLHGEIMFICWTDSGGDSCAPTT